MVSDRICTMCKIVKPFSEFFNSKKGKWGKAEQCKDCRRIKNREYYHANPEKCLAKTARWAKKNRHKIAARVREHYKANSEQYKKRTKEYRARTGNKSIHTYKKNNPDKRAAHRYVDMAVRFGHLIRPDCCDVCKIQCKPHAHHTDYKKPLEVRWLCPPCHGIEHRVYTNSEQLERLNEKTSKEDAIV